MNKGIVLIGIGVIVIALLLGSHYYQSDDESTGYKPGDVVNIRIPPTGTAYKLVSEPMYVRYYLKNPLGNTVHIEDHEVTYKKSELLGWSFYDEHKVIIGAFTMEGLWTLEGEAHSTVLGVIDIGEAFPVSKEFQVKEGTIIDNILAPIYLHGENPLSFLFGTTDITLPPLMYPIGAVLVFIGLAVINSHLRDIRITKRVTRQLKRAKA